LDYQQAFDLQDRLLEKRITGEIGDTLLLLEHPPTLTMGKKDDADNLLVPESVLKSHGIAVYPTDRGGSITWHGPGQLVVYPIMDLSSRGKDIHQYIWSLEEVIIRTLQAFSVSAGRDEQHIGVWVGAEKIAAIGVKVRKWVTKHGFAVNVGSDLSHFSMINPCGITDKGVVSLSRILSRPVSVEDVQQVIMDTFAEVFDVAVETGSSNDGIASEEPLGLE